MLAVLLAVALAAELPADTVQSETVRSGAVRDRVVHDDADLVIFYTSEQDGILGTCGCSANPRGGLARIGGYLDAVDRLGPGTPELRVNAGRWATDRIGDTLELRPDAVLQNHAMVAGFEELGFDALNISFRDAPFLRGRSIPEIAVSANAADRVQAARFVEVGPWTVAVTGVGRPGSPYLQPEDFAWDDPVQALSEAVPELREQADLVVVLAFETGPDTRQITAIDGVDVVIEAGAFAGRLEPWFEGGAVWVQSRDAGQALGELRLWIDEDGAVAAVRDRWVDLDPAVPEVSSLRKLKRRTERDRIRALRAAGYAD